MAITSELATKSNMDESGSGSASQEMLLRQRKGRFPQMDSVSKLLEHERERRRLTKERSGFASDNRNIINDFNWPPGMFWTSGRIGPIPHRAKVVEESGCCWWVE